MAIALSLIASAGLSAAIYACSTLLPLFDASPTLVPNLPWSLPGLRWDTFHFLHLAQEGYTHEHLWAFLPGLPSIIRYSNLVTRKFFWISDDLIVVTSLVSTVVALDTTRVLYKLSLKHLKSPSLALMTSILALLPASPPTLRFASYTEPFFTYFSYQGMLACSEASWLSATFYFALAASFRSNGFLLAGFILWGLLIQPVIFTRTAIQAKNIAHSILSSAAIFAPFVYHQYIGYTSFCFNEQRPQWCDQFPPAIYSHVQSHYWNVGFFRYWTLQQLPNFVLAAPVLILLFGFSCWHLISILSPASFRESPFLSPAITPHAIHAFITSCILLFTSHTQIALRIGASMPLTYWAAAWLLLEHPKIGKWYISWSISWAVSSVMLWTSFLPPA